MQPSDGKLDGPPSEAVVAVLNTPPLVEEVTLSSTVPLTSEDVMAAVTSLDVDGDEVAVSYRWTRDGNETGYTESTLPASATQRGDIWTLYVIPVVTVTVTPDDGEDGGSPTSTSTTVLNSPPEPPTIHIEPRWPQGTEDDLVCTMDAGSIDADGDPVSYTFAWEVDGSAFTDTESTNYLDDTVPADETLANEIWTCTVTPGDGTDPGEAATAEVDIAGIIFSDNFDTDIGWTNVSGGNFTTADGYLEWEINQYLGQLQYHPIASHTGYHSIEFDLLVEDLTEIQSAHGLYIGLAAGSSFGSLDYPSTGVYLNIAHSSSTDFQVGMVMKGSAGTSVATNMRLYTSAWYHIEVDFEDFSYWYAYDEHGLLVDEGTRGSSSFYYGPFEYVFIGHGDSTCCEANGYLDNLIIRSLEEDGDTG